MKNSRKFRFWLIPSFLLTAVLMFSFSTVQLPQEKWEVPGKYKKMENPMADDSEALTIGKQVYSKQQK